MRKFTLFTVFHAVLSVAASGPLPAPSAHFA